MPQDLYAAYNSLSVARKKEAYDFIMRLSFFEKNKNTNPKRVFGSLSKKATVDFSDDWELSTEEFLGL